MAPKALDILKNSLAIFSKKIKDRREEFNAKLSRTETISSADEHWLDNDNEGNTVEEQRVLDGSFNGQLSLDEANDMKTTVITDFFRRA